MTEEQKTIILDKLINKAAAKGYRELLANKPDFSVEEYNLMVVTTLASIAFDAGYALGKAGSVEQEKDFLTFANIF